MTCLASDRRFTCRFLLIGVQHFFVVVDSLACQGTPLSGSGVAGFFVASSTYDIAWLLSEYIVCNCISKASALCLSLKERQEMLREVTHGTRHIQTSQLSHAIVRLTISAVITQSHNGGLISHGLLSVSMTDCP